jgi:hypothetical protein
MMCAKYAAPTNTTVTFAASADNGSNYESHTENSTHAYTNTGTQLKTKVTLTTSDGVNFPTLYMYGYHWGP